MIDAVVAPGNRPRSRDIAKRLGVSETAVSFALNGRAGISDDTRNRILAMIDELGWTPNYAARALSGSRSFTVGLVIARTTQDVGSEAFFLQLMTGMQASLSTAHYGLLFQVVSSLDEEIDVYRRWRNEGRVDGLVLIDLRSNDPRPSALARLGLPAILAGGPDPSGVISSVSIDDALAMGLAVDHLRALGHHRIAYVTGSVEMLHVQHRVDAIHALARRHRLGQVWVERTDFSTGAAIAVTEGLLAAPRRPSAIIYENEVLAVAGLSVLHAKGADIPRDIAVVSLEDSIICTATRPQLTSLHRDTWEFGKEVADHLLLKIGGQEPPSTHERAPALAVRRSTDPSAPIDSVPGNPSVPLPLDPPAAR